MGIAAISDLDIAKYQEDDISLNSLFGNSETERLEQALDEIVEMSDEFWEELNVPDSVWDEPFLIY